MAVFVASLIVLFVSVISFIVSLIAWGYTDSNERSSLHPMFWVVL